MSRIAAALSVLAFFAASSAFTPARADRNVLWTLVHDLCTPHEEAGQVPPKPCDLVDIASGEAFLKDRNGVAQMLGIPTRRVTGIEDPFLLTPEAPNYFAVAWTEGMPLFGKHLKAAPPREDMAITVNSEFSRSQDQLHLHVNCLAKDAAEALKAYAPSLDETWRPMTVALNGRRYWARRIDGDTLTASPFLLLAEGIPGAKAEMGLWSVGAAGAAFGGKPGFILLADHAELTEGGHAEDIQDPECAVAKPAP